jgi:uncharacterized delta-60 repeat protein
MENTAPFFGGTGTVGKILPRTGEEDLAFKIAVLADGKFLVLGNSDYRVSVSRYLANGAPDMSFGSNGMVLVDQGRLDFCTELLVQSDGQILVTGDSRDKLSFDAELLLMRFTKDGKLDTSFGGDGIVRHKYYDATGQSLAVTAEGNILVGTSPMNIGASVVAFHPDGSLAAMFSGANEYKFSSSVATTDPKVIVQAGGAILLFDSYWVRDVVGYDGRYNVELHRLTPAGAVDGSLDPQALAHPDLGLDLRLVDVDVQADGKVLVCAYVQYSYFNGDALLMRFDNNKLDPSFGVNGIARLGVDDLASFFQLVIAPDGKLLIAGTISSVATLTNDIALFRLNANGTPDKDFGIDGMLRNNLGSLEHVRGVDVQADGKILVSGSAGQLYTPFIARFNADGFPDRSFASQGSTYAPPTYTEGGAPVVLDARLNVTDLELTDAWSKYGNSSLTLSRHAPDAADVFSSTGRLGPMVKGQDLTLNGLAIAKVLDNSQGRLYLQFNVNATQAAVNEVLQSIAYENKSDAPPASVTLNWVFDDGGVVLWGPVAKLYAATSTEVKLVGVNDAPQGRDTTVETISTFSYTLKASNFGSTDAEDGALFTSVRIENLPAHGTLLFHGSAVSAGQVFTAADLASGKLTFTGSGSGDLSVLGFSVRDSAGLADPVPNSLVFSIFLPTVNGTGGNDLLVSTKANDKFFGGAGTDFVQFAGARAEYTVLNNGTTITVSDTLGRDGSDSLKTVERLKFSDMNLAFDVNGNGGQAYRMYQAAFDRKPDAAGLGYWIGAMDKGLGRNEVAQQFVGSAEFKTLYGAQASNAELVNKFYANVLHRAPDAAGSAYWLDVLDMHTMNVGEVLAQFSESAENQAALVGVISAGVSYFG